MKSKIQNLMKTNPCLNCKHANNLNGDLSCNLKKEEFWNDIQGYSYNKKFENVKKCESHEE